MDLCVAELLDVAGALDKVRPISFRRYQELRQWSDTIEGQIDCLVRRAPIGNTGGPPGRLWPEPIQYFNSMAHWESSNAPIQTPYWLSTGTIPEGGSWH